MITFNQEEINRAFELRRNILRAAKKDKRFGFNAPLHNFIEMMSLLNTQTYGVRLQNYWLSRFFNCDSLDSKSNRGDFEKNGKYGELKISLITNENQALNMVQIRLSHEIDYYYGIAIDIRDYPEKPIVIYPFKLTKSEMIEEVQIIGTNAHGTQNREYNDLTLEKRLSVPINEKNVHFSRWTERYLDLELAKKWSIKIEKNECVVFAELKNDLTEVTLTNLKIEKLKKRVANLQNYKQSLIVNPNEMCPMKKIEQDIYELEFKILEFEDTLQERFVA